MSDCPPRDARWQRHLQEKDEEKDQSLSLGASRRIQKRARPLDLPDDLRRRVVWDAGVDERYRKKKQARPSLDYEPDVIDQHPEGDRFVIPPPDRPLDSGDRECAPIPWSSDPVLAAQEKADAAARGKAIMDARKARHAAPKGGPKLLPLSDEVEAEPDDDDSYEAMMQQMVTEFKGITLAAENTRNIYSRSTLSSDPLRDKKNGQGDQKMEKIRKLLNSMVRSDTRTHLRHLGFSRFPVLFCLFLSGVLLVEFDECALRFLCLLFILFLLPFSFAARRVSLD
jgi:hypothetical protein